MSVVHLALVAIGLLLVVAGAVALVNASYIAGAVLVLVGLIVLGASRGGLTL